MTAAVQLDDAVALTQQVARGDVTPAALAAAVTEAASGSERLNCLTDHSAPGLDQRAAAAGDGPLRGLPVVVKDCFDTQGLATTAGTAALSGRIPSRDADAVAKLRRAGAFVAGKNTMHELSFGITSNNAWTGPVRNPVDPSLIPGGSSGGTAAAVAAGIAPVGLAADTGGSARIPAALCGVVGFRPTHGRYPTGGVVPISHSRDTPGLIAGTVAEIRLIDAVLTDAIGHPATTMQVTDVRLGVPTEFWSDLDPDLEAVAVHAATALAASGIEMVPVDVSELASMADQIGTPLCLREMPEDLAAYLNRESDRLTPADVFDQVASPDVREIVALLRDSEPVDTSAYQALLITRSRLRARYSALLHTHQIHALIFPTTPLPARPIGEDSHTNLAGQVVPTFATYIRHTNLAGVAGHPGISLPAGKTAGGLPVGIELDGRVDEDLDLLALAQTIADLLQATNENAR